MLDRLERHHHIHTGIGQGNRRGAARHETQVLVLLVAFARVRDRLIGNVHANNRLRAGRHEGGSISLAAGDVEHVLAGSYIQRPAVAVHMLVADRPFFGGNRSFAGKVKH